jgi:diguanylate cyclase (GGDEF)-like protein/PAS domain S-box-containing protein
MFLTARTLFINKTRSVTSSALFLAIVSVAIGGVLTVSTLFSIIALPDTNAFTASAGQVEVVPIFSSFFATTLMTVGCILLVNQRLASETIEAKDHFESIFNTSPDASVLSRLDDGMIVNINTGFTALSGYTQSEVVGKSSLDINIWANPADRQRMVAAVLKNGYCNNFETDFKRRDGSLFKGLTSVSLIDLDGKPHMMSVTRDITELKLAEESLRESEEKHRVMFRNSPSASLIIVDNIFVDCNHAAEIMLRGDRAQIIGKSPDELSPEFQPDGSKSSSAKDRIAAALRVGTLTFEWIHRRLDGTNLLVEVSLAAIQLNGKSALFVTWHDITKRKETENLSRARLDLINFSAAHSLKEILQKTLDEVCELTHSPIGFYHFVGDDQKTLTLQAWSTRTIQEFCQASGAGMHYPVDQAGVWADCVQTKQPVIHNDYPNLPHRKGLPEGHAQVIRELVVPILRNDKVVAILGIGNKAGEYTDPDVELVWYFADVAWEIAERKQAEEELHETNAYLENLINHANAPIIVWDPQFRITRFNYAVEDLTGWSEAEVLGLSLEMLFPPEFAENTMEMIRKTAAGERWETVEIIIQHRDGWKRTVLWNSATLSGTDGKPIATIAQGQDITERKLVIEMLSESNAYLENLVNYANTPIIVWNPSFCITRFNRAFERLTGYSEDEVKGQSLEMLLPPEFIKSSMELIRKTATGERWETVEIKIQHRDGEVRTVLWNSATLFGADGHTPISTIAQGQDITERKRLEDKLKQQATTDALTGITNRRRFMELAENEIKRGIRLKHPMAMAVIDLDHFKQINDTHGHSTGDLALIAFTQICKKNIREIDIFARFGGDEFVLLFPETARDDAYMVMERVRLALTSQPIDLGGKLVPMTLSAGIAHLTDESISLDALLEHADQALYKAKEAGRNHVDGMS